MSAEPVIMDVPEEEEGGETVVVERGGVTYTFDRKLLFRLSAYVEANYSFLVKKAEQNVGSGGGGDVCIRRMELPEEDVSDEALDVVACYVDQQGPAVGPGREEGHFPLCELNVFDTLNAAMFLHIEGLVKVCIDFIVRENVISSENFAEAWVFADRLGCKELAGHVLGMVVGPAETFRRQRNGEFDLVLVAASLKFRCHRSVVEAATNIFSDSGSRGISVKRDGDGVTTVDLSEYLFAGFDLTDVSYHRLQALFHLVNFLYDSSADGVSGEVIPALLTLARLFGMSALQLKVYESFVPDDGESWREMYDVARRHKSRRLLDFSLSHLCRNLPKLTMYAAVLRPEEMEAVLGSDCLRASEGQVLTLLCTWTAAMEETRLPMLDRLLGLIRFRCLTQREVEEAMTSGYRAKIESAIDRAARKPLPRTREWPKEILMVEQPHPRCRVKPEARRQMGIHLYDFGAKERPWRSHRGPGLRNMFSVAFDPAASRLMYCQPRPGRDVTIVTYDLNGSRPRRHQKHVVKCLGADAHSVAAWAPDDPDGLPLLLTPMMPTKSEKKAVLKTDLRRAAYGYEPSVYPAPEGSRSQDMPVSKVTDAERTEERTYETRLVADPWRGRCLLVSPNFRDDVGKGCNARPVSASSASRQLRWPEDAPRGPFEASYAAAGPDHVARVGGWSYQDMTKPNKTDQDQKISPYVRPRLCSSREVQLFSADTFQPGVRQPSLKRGRDCCGCVFYKGALYALGGLTRKEMEPGKAERLLQKRQKKKEKRAKSKKQRRRDVWDRPTEGFNDPVVHESRPELSMERLVPRKSPAGAQEWEVVSPGEFPRLKSGYVAAFLVDAPACRVKI